MVGEHLLVHHHGPALVGGVGELVEVDAEPAELAVVLGQAGDMLGAEALLGFDALARGARAARPTACSLPRRASISGEALGMRRQTGAGHRSSLRAGEGRVRRRFGPRWRLLVRVWRGRGGRWWRGAGRSRQRCSTLCLSCLSLPLGPLPRGCSLVLLACRVDFARCCALASDSRRVSHMFMHLSCFLVARMVRSIALLRFARARLTRHWLQRCFMADNKTDSPEETSPVEAAEAAWIGWRPSWRHRRSGRRSGGCLPKIENAIEAGRPTSRSSRRCARAASR